MIASQFFAINVGSMDRESPGLAETCNRVYDFQQLTRTGNALPKFFHAIVKLRALAGEGNDDLLAP